MKWVPRAICLGFILFFHVQAPVSWGLSFLDPLFERNDPDELKASLLKLKEKDEKSAAEQVEYLQLQYFIGEALWFHGRIHEKSTYWNALENDCNHLYDADFAQVTDERQKAYAKLSCALFYIAKTKESHPLLQWALVVKVDRLMAQAGQSQGVDQGDRRYIEGRVYYAIPRNLGQRVGKSLFNLQLLVRMKPEAPSVAYWLGYIYLQHGNETEAKKYFEQALEKKDPRAILWFKNHYYRNQELLDGRTSGWSPHFFVSPTLGFGFGLALYDARLFDTDRSGDVIFTITTRENFDVAIDYEDRSLFKGFKFQLGFAAGQYREEYFGLGMGSPRSNITQLKNQRASGHFRAVQPFWDYFYFALGWQYASSKIPSATGGSFNSDPLPDRTRSVHNGPIAAIGYDSRDSVKAPRMGYKIEVSGYFPSTALLSDYSFENINFVSEGYFLLARRHLLSARLGGYFLTGAAPYSAYARLGQSLGLPAIRAGRFQEKNALGGALEYKMEVAKTFSLLLFSTLGRVADTPSNLFQSSFKAGAGFGVLFHPIRYHQPSLRLEAGIFASEFVIMGRAGINL